MILEYHYASDLVKNFTDPVYNWFQRYGFLIICLLIIAVSIRSIIKSVQYIKSKKWSKIPYGNTNEWFSIEGSQNNADCNDKME